MIWLKFNLQSNLYNFLIEFKFSGLVSKENDLPSITASLFQSPGGRKFLEFMNPFVRYVAIYYLKVRFMKTLND